MSVDTLCHTFETSVKTFTSNAVDMEVCVVRVNVVYTKGIIVNKTPKPTGVRARSFHDSFVWMVHAAITWPQTWNAGAILRYWFRVAFDRDPVPSDLDKGTFDRIRLRLRNKGGFVGLSDPLESTLVRRVRDAITFIDERGFHDEEETKVWDSPDPPKTRRRSQGKQAKRFRRV